MANKSKKSQLGLTGLVLTVIGLAAAVMSFVSLAFDFIALKTTAVRTGQSYTESLGLGDWFESIDGLKDSDKIAGWNLGRVFLIITLVMVAILAVALIVKFFMNHKILNLGVMVVSVLTMVSALVFAIATFAGCGALSTELLGVKLDYIASVGVYLVALFSIVTAAMSIVVCRKTK